MTRLSITTLLLAILCCGNVSGMVLCFDRSGDVSLDVACGGERCCAPETCCDESSESSLSDHHDCCVDIPLPSLDDAETLVPTSSRHPVDSKLTQISGVVFPGDMPVSATEARSASPPSKSPPALGCSTALIALRI